MSEGNVTIKEVSFSRKFNLGNYETMDIGFIATIAEAQNPENVLRALDKATVEYKKIHIEEHNHE